MPNWCMNDLIITAPTSVIKEIVESQLSLQKLFPCPQELLETTAPAPSDKADLYEAKYGHSDWYSWQVSNWGTKWDIGPVDMSFDSHTTNNENGTHTLSVGFDSAWSPPVEAMKKLYERYKDQNIKIRLEYFEGGCAFLGVAQTTDDGFFDECYDYENADDLQSWVDELEHNLASCEADYLREREEEDRQFELEKKAQEEPALKDLNKPVKKTNSKKKTATKSKKVSKKNTTKKVAKKPARKPNKKTSKKVATKKKVKKK